MRLREKYSTSVSVFPHSHMFKFMFIFCMSVWLVCLFHASDTWLWRHGDTSDSNNATRYILNKSSTFRVYHFDFVCTVLCWLGMSVRTPTHNVSILLFCGEKENIVYIEFIRNQKTGLELDSQSLKQTPSGIISVRNFMMITICAEMHAKIHSFYKRCTYFFLVSCDR